MYISPYRHRHTSNVTHAHRKYSTASFDEIAVWDHALHPVQARLVYFQSTGQGLLPEEMRLQSGGTKILYVVKLKKYALYFKVRLCLSEIER